MKTAPQFVGQAFSLRTSWGRRSCRLPCAGFIRSTGLLLALAASSVLAQTGPDALTVSVVVADATGAAIASAEVALNRDGSQPRTAFTDNSGNFRFVGVPAGRYELVVRREGFTPERTPLTVADHSPAGVHITLQLTGVRQEVTITGTAEEVSTHPADHLDTVTLNRDLLDNLPIFDQNYVAMMSQFLDPGSVSTNGVTLVVNGMEPRNIGVSASAIQQVKINQNPYAADFSRPGRGCIEILTKPASQDFHGTLNVRFRDQGFNACDPFALTDAQSVVFAETLAGPNRQDVPNPQCSTDVSAGITSNWIFE